MRLPLFFLMASLTACGSASAPDTARADAGNLTSAKAAPVKSAAPAKGQPPLAFVQCGTCHQTKPGQNGIGPSLAGVYGAKAGHVGDFAYSAPMRASGLIWDEATLDKFITNPRAQVPGTRMSYAGLRDEGQRAEIIAYLKTL